ncbi:MAG: branched-chain amino acid ABC transporter permease [Alphaproteobacteria bacterium]|nr:branched-chain amino acid ABC transporter permease [Alphaproteobacteria bacterium]
MVADPYTLSVLTLVLWLAYTGQAWNVMMGFAGQLSLGHTLYVGLAAYTSAALFVHLGLGPWLGLWVAIAVAALVGGAIGALGFRFGMRGVYFALLTIAFAEFTRIAFDHFGWVGGSAGFFLPVAQRTSNDLINLRGTPTMFYYIVLALVGGALLLCRALLKSRLGYYWLAIREDQEAAQAVGIDVFRYKLLAVVISAALTAPAGVFYAFFYNNMYPEQIFAISRSIEIILGAIVGGIGTLFGPVLGAFILTPLGELVTWAIEHAGINVPGAKQLVYGALMVVIVVFLPDGIWPWLARRLKLGGAP